MSSITCHSCRKIFPKEGFSLSHSLVSLLQRCTVVLSLGCTPSEATSWEQCLLVNSHHLSAVLHEMFSPVLTDSMCYSHEKPLLMRLVSFWHFSSYHDFMMCRWEKQEQIRHLLGKATTLSKYKNRLKIWIANKAVNDATLPFVLKK